MSTLLSVTKWPPNFRMIFICYVFFVQTTPYAFAFPILNINIINFGISNGISAAPISHNIMEMANVPNPVGFMHTT